MAVGSRWGWPMSASGISRTLWFSSLATLFLLLAACGPRPLSVTPPATPTLALPPTWTPTSSPAIGHETKALPSSSPSVPADIATPSPSATTPEPRCDSKCRQALLRVTLLTDDLPGSWYVFEYDPVFGLTALPGIIGEGIEGRSFSFHADGRTINGGTVFLPGSRDQDAFDRITAAPERFLARLYDALRVTDVAVSDGPTLQETDAGPSMEVSGTCLFRGFGERQAFDVTLFRDRFLGVAIFYVYAVGDTPDPNIASVAGILREKIAMALDPNATATLPSYSFETATPHSGQPAAGQEVRDAQCAVSFSVSAGLEVFRVEDRPCFWGFRPTTWPSAVAPKELALYDYAFWVSVTDRPLEDVGPFELHSGQWFVLDPLTLIKFPATAVRDGGLIIVRSTELLKPVAVVSNDIRSALVVAERENFEPAFELVLQSLRFLEP